MNTSSKCQTASGPATAISSSLSTRPTPSIPPASLVYEPLVKTILARRFVYNVLSVSAAAAWVLTAFWTAWQLGGLESLGMLGWLLNWFSPLTLFCATLWWSSASVPIAVLRKSYTKAGCSSSLSPRQTLFQHASERQYQRALLVTLVSSACLATYHSIMAQTVEKSARGDPKLGIWAGSRKHPYHLNGRLCFLFLSQLSCALFYWLRDILKIRLSIRWSSQSNLWVQAFPSLITSVLSISMLSATSMASSLLIFCVLRSTVLPILYRLPIIHNFLRPFTAHFLRPTFTITFLWYHFDLIIRAFFLALSSQILWDISSTMFDAVFSFPVAATEASKDSGLILVSGINSTEPYFQFHAFHELCLLSSDSDHMAAKRAVIYSDAKHSPSLWATLLRRSLLVLGSDYQLFLRRGNPPQPPQPPQALEPPVTKPSISTEKTTTPVIRTQVFKTHQVTPIDQLAETLSSDGSVTGALTRSTADSIGFSEIFRATLHSWTHSASINVVTPDASKVATSTVSSVSRFVPPSWLRMHDVTIWWTRERKDKAAQKALPNKELDVMIVEVLSNLVSHSLREDMLGHVQRDIPRVLEAMILFLSAIEDYQLELSGIVSAMELRDTKSEDELIVLKTETTLASEWVEGLSTELRTGISLVVNTFGDRLTKFKFPPSIAFKLQSFVDYST